MKKYFFGFSILSVFLFAQKLSAHVGYVVSKEEFVSNSGTDWKFFGEVLKDPKNILIMLVTIILALLVVLLSRKFEKSRIRKIRDHLEKYDIYVPWVIRLSIGISLIGAGTANVLISPIEAGLNMFTMFSTAEIFIGFLVLGGAFVIPSVLVLIGFYFLALTRNFYMIGNADFLALLLAYLCHNSAKPGFDDIFSMNLLHTWQLPKKYLPVILRVGIGTAMAFLAIYEKILNPHVSELVVYKYNLMHAFPVSAGMWVLSAGIIELLVATMLFFGVFTRVTSAVTFVILSLSFFFFKEAVFSHVTLFGLLSVLFITGGGAHSFDHWFKKWEERNRVTL